MQDVYINIRQAYQMFDLCFMFYMCTINFWDKFFICVFGHKHKLVYFSQFDHI